MSDLVLAHITPQTFMAVQWFLIGACALGAARNLGRLL